MTNELRQKWRKFKCWITGGHKYKPGDFKTVEFPEKRAMCFIHQCVKCGEYKVYALDTSVLYSYVPPKLFNDF